MAEYATANGVRTWYAVGGKALVVRPLGEAHDNKPKHLAIDVARVYLHPLGDIPCRLPPQG